MAPKSFFIMLLAFLIAVASAKALDEELLSDTFYDCHWICKSYGVFMECEFDEVVVGACGAKSWANCENRNYCPGMSGIYAAIKCCKMNVLVDDVN